MYALNVSLRLKPGCIRGFDEFLRSSLLPLLSSKQGFQDELTYSGASLLDVSLITMWDSQKDADAFGRTLSAEMLDGLQAFIEEIPSEEFRDSQLRVSQRCSTLTTRARCLRQQQIYRDIES